VNFWLILGISVAVVYLNYRAYTDGMKRGKIEGYRQGQIDANLWWTHTEQQVQDTQQELWRKQREQKLWRDNS